MTTSTIQKRILIVANPAAGGLKPLYLDNIIAELAKHNLTPEIYFTQKAGDAEKTLPTLCNNFDIIIAAGGDGTVNEVINGLSYSDKIIGIIPCGTTNVLATELHLPKQPKAIADMIAKGQYKNIHCARVNNRRFGMMVGIGYDAWVVNAVDLTLKKKIGKLAYVLAMIQQLKEFGKKHYQIHINNSYHTASTIICTLGKHYAGSYILAKDAHIEEANFDAILVQTESRWAFFLLLLVLPLGLAQKLSFIKTLKGSQMNIIAWPPKSSHEHEVIQADGDLAGHLPAEIICEQRASRILVP